MEIKMNCYSSPDEAETRCEDGCDIYEELGQEEDAYDCYQCINAYHGSECVDIIYETDPCWDRCGIWTGLI
jgi:hypothetical protein